MNVECSAILLNKVPEKLGDLGKFLIPCVLQDLEVCSSLADSGDSINLMSLSIYEKLRIGPLKPTRMTLELANRSITYPMRIAEDVIVRVDKFNFLADFVIVDFEVDPRVPIILGRPFLRTTKALNPPSRECHSVHSINIIDSPYEEISNQNKQSSGSTTSYSNLSLPDYEVFCFEEKSSGSTTSHSDYSLLEYESFFFDVDQIEEKSSGSTTSHFDLSLLEYDSFHFDLLIDQLPPADRSDSHHEEFADELAHIISSTEYDCFYFDIEPDLGELTILFEENISEDSTKELTSPELNNFPFFLSDYKVFNPGIFIIKGVQSQRLYILPLDDFSTNSFVSDSLLLIDPSEIKTFLSFPSGNEDKVFDPRILIIDGVFSFTRKSPHLLINNFKIDKRPILSEISLMTESSVSFLPKDKEIRGEIPYDLEDLRACFQSSNHAVSDHFHDYILGILNPDHIYIWFFLVTDDMKLLDGWLFSMDILARFDSSFNLINNDEKEKDKRVRGLVVLNRLLNLQARGPSYPVELGRLDGLSSTTASVGGKLPKPNQNLDQLNAMFSANGLTQADMIALSVEAINKGLWGKPCCKLHKLYLVEFLIKMKCMLLTLSPFRANVNVLKVKIKEYSKKYAKFCGNMFAKLSAIKVYCFFVRRFTRYVWCCDFNFNWDQ
ncbi:reverse transcriptase domain-containing protein [Tanacetum coccineum]